MSSFTLRRAVASDVGDIAMLLRRVQETTVPFRPDLHTPEEDRAFLGRLMRSHDIRVAESAGAVAGFIAYRNGTVDHLYVDPGQQGRGIGTALLRRAMADAPELQLWCFKRNVAALRFYERCGFRPVGETDGASNEEREPDVLLRWRR